MNKMVEEEIIRQLESGELKEIKVNAIMEIGRLVERRLKKGHPALISKDGSKLFRCSKGWASKLLKRFG